MYSLTSDVQITAAIRLRDSAREFFRPYLGADCDGRYDNGRLCMILDHPINETLVGGPFPSGEVGALGVELMALTWSDL